MSDVVKTCDFCGKEFAAHRVDQHLCSRKCHVAYHHAQRAAKRAAKRASSGKHNPAIVKETGETLHIKCEICDRVFAIEKTNTAYGRKYCSEQCRKEAHAKQRLERNKKLATICYSVQSSENGRFPSDGMCSALKDVMRKYPVLTAEEESELMRQEPERRQELLVLHNVRLVFNMAKRWGSRSRYMDADDMIQIGLVALMEAARRFRGECRFFSFAMCVIKNRFKAELRHSYMFVDARCDSLNRKMDAVGSDDEESGELLDFIQPSIVAEFQETSLAEWLEYRDGIEFAARAIHDGGRSHAIAS